MKVTLDPCANPFAAAGPTRPAASIALHAPAAVRAAAERLAAELGDDALDAWALCGDARRNVPARDAVLVVRPRYAGDRNVAWSRAAALGARPVDPGRPEGRLRLTFAGHAHHLVPATRADWGVRLAELTGPADYFALLVRRLESAGRLTLDWTGGTVCWRERAAGGPRYHPIQVRDEAEFFRLCRTKYLPAPLRFARVARAWRRGMRLPWYPDDVPPPLPLFTTKQPTRPRDQAERPGRAGGDR